jgi:hypothetical protein
LDVRIENEGDLLCHPHPKSREKEYCKLAFFQRRKDSVNLTSFKREGILDSYYSKGMPNSYDSKLFLTSY